MSSAQRIVQKGAREAPVAIDRTSGEAEHLRNLFERQAGEVAQLDHMRRARIQLLQALSRSLAHQI